ncbi:hypothetical protein MS5380_51470 [Klebsiella pneumoniae]|nr:hypothetical protein VEE12_45820 [Escherichia coli]GKN21683.1 hypothetical protein MS5380_51470 [Klebsiella pneumoniae]
MKDRINKILDNSINITIKIIINTIFAFISVNIICISMYCVIKLMNWLFF